MLILEVALNVQFVVATSGMRLMMKPSLMLAVLIWVIWMLWLLRLRPMHQLLRHLLLFRLWLLRFVRLHRVAALMMTRMRMTTSQ
jgi:hypothetical protein